MTAALLLSLALSASPAGAVPPEAVSLVLVVASNRGTQAGRPPLQYADDDGAKYFEVFSAIAGEENTVLLTDLDRDTARLFPALLDKARSPTRAQLDLAAVKLARKAAEARRAGRRVRFHFVFAGHGDVDQGRGFLELADGPFTADDLQALLRRIDAAESHVILDSCNSFFVVNPRRPGGVRFATPRDAAEALSRRLPNVGVFLSTAARAEVYEWSELQSGVFSHAVRSGIMGAADANGDGHVTYDELAGFVETAAADIKNPLFRPAIYARGPNGEDGRAIVDVPAAARAVLTIEEPGPVRLAARDADGVRWLDAYKEPDATVTLWFPASLAGRLEIDRLKVDGTQRGQVEASFAFPADADFTSLAALAPRSRAVALRGAGEIFQSLFSRPYGPAAFAAYLEHRATPSGQDFDVPAGASARDRDARELPAPESSPDARAALFAVVRPVVNVPWLSAHGALIGLENPGADATVSVAVGYAPSRFLSGELEAGYLAVSGTASHFAYPSQGYLFDTIFGTAVSLRAVPVALNVRWQLAWWDPRPYVVAGAGVAPTHVTLDPSDFSATLRATRYVPFFHAGLGLTFDMGERLFAGFEGRYYLMRDIQLFNARLGISGVTGAAFFGARL